ncbi:MAG: hypothetical protein KatS3mg011_0843 [Acidimicrobiia bacterium]|nr:MAG: hypothetical protein KatS3mg011_0843 [Acidimicrobiia bacterium]
MRTVGALMGWMEGGLRLVRRSMGRGLETLAPQVPPDLTHMVRPLGPRPTVAVVIPAHDAAETLPDQLEALADQDYPGPWEVVVVDDGSGDDTRSVAEGFAGRMDLRVTTTPRRLGSPGARNWGASSASADILCFCDADDRVSAAWISSYVEALQRAPAAAGPLHPSDRPDVDTQPWRDPEPGRFSHASSGNFAIRSDIFHALGGFRADYPAHLAELDFSWRLQAAGLKYALADGAAVWYRIRDDLGDLWRQRVAWGIEEALARRLYGRSHMPHERAVATVKSYLWLMRRLPQLKSREARRQWVKVAGPRWGRLVGSLRYRVLYL